MGLNRDPLDAGYVLSGVSPKMVNGLSMLLNRLNIYGDIHVDAVRSKYRIKIKGDSAYLLAEILGKAPSSHATCSCHINSYKIQNHVFLDPIVEIKVIGVEDHPKVYDLTIPSNLNFGLANGLQVRDTSQTGYIQRRLIKGLEDLKVEYDMTVRNSKKKNDF